MLNLNENLEETQERWEKIESLVKEMNAKLESGENVDNIVPSILTLMVDHLRPMTPTKEQLADATKGLSDLLNSLKQG
jgi:hypothetical protein